MKTQELIKAYRPVAKLGLLSAVFVASSLTTVQAGWRLECGGRSPAWSVVVFPKALKARVDGKSAMLPILSKRQAHGNRNKVAIKTQIRSKNRADRLDLTLTFTKNCRSSVNGKLMSFRAQGDFNQTSLSGCCRAVRG
ncbi:hypothetical protein [uncultured Thiothrix sp.]|uniref:hypothetical protein n=1 Tax=uncultured Thiothrix sp. TaxID=223185 RepID=UPI002608F7DF|nr:hypothetical protein [uncultured Thiothrix sp.]